MNRKLLILLAGLLAPVSTLAQTDGELIADAINRLALATCEQAVQTRNLAIATRSNNALFGNAATAVESARSQLNAQAFESWPAGRPFAFPYESSGSWSGHRIIYAPGGCKELIDNADNIPPITP